MKKNNKKRLRKKYLTSFQRLSLVFLIFSNIQIFFLEQPLVSAYETEIKILYDTEHSFVSFSSYNDFMENLKENHNIQIFFANEKLTLDVLYRYDILVIATPIEIFSKEERYCIKKFVEEGGNLLLMGNGWYWRHYHEKPLAEFPFNRLGKEFGVTINDDIIVDPTNYRDSRYYPVFHHFADHPATEGIKEIRTTNPCSLTLEGDVIPIVWGDSNTYSGNIYLQPYKTGETPPVVAALEYGKGRGIFIGADSFFDNTNVSNEDNLKFGLNIFSWFIENKPTFSKTALSISSIPSSAKVFIKNEYRGLTPLEVEIDPGKYEVRIEKEDYDPRTETIEVALGETKNVSVELNLKKADLSITSDPSASVYINDTYKGETPLDLELEKGKYEIRIEKEGYERYTGTIELFTGESKSISVDLTKATPSPTTTSAPTTSPPTTTPAPTTSPTSAPPQQFNSLLYLGIFGAIVISVIVVCLITKKKPEKEVIEKVKKEKQIEMKPEESEKCPEREEKIKREIEDNKLYLKNLTIMYKRGEVRKKVYERMKKGYEDKIKELEKKLKRGD